MYNKLLGKRKPLELKRKNLEELETTSKEVTYVSKEELVKAAAIAGLAPSCGEKGENQKLWRCSGGPAHGRKRLICDK